MATTKIYVVHAGETTVFPDEFSKPVYEIVDGRQFALNAQLNESSVIKALVDNPPEADYIGFAQYRRHLSLPVELEQDKIYAHMEHCLGRSNADDFARFHSAPVLRKFIDRVDDAFMKFWLNMYMEQTQAWQRNCFLMSTQRFRNSFTPWFNACFRAANVVLPDVIAANYGTYQQRMCGMLLERGIGSYIWQSNMGVSCPLVTYDLASPWQREADELKTYIDGPWNKEW